MKVLFIDNAHEILSEELKKAGFEIDCRNELSRDDIEQIIENYTGIIIRSRIAVDKSFLDKAKNLKFIGRVGSGMEGIDLKYAATKGIKCLNSPEGNRDAVGEHAIGLLLNLLNKINKADREVRNGIWNREQNRGIEIKGKTIGIIGYGNMGSSFAKKLSGFEVNVIGYDKYKKGYTDNFVKESTMQEIFEKADILSLHIPLTEETFHLVNAKYLDSFKKSIFLINTSRGKIVKTEDLSEKIKTGKVLGAGLDVIEYEDSSFEKMNDSKQTALNNFLSNAKNVIITPHIAGWTVESKYKLAKVLAEKIISLNLK